MTLPPSRRLCLSFLCSTLLISARQQSTAADSPAEDWVCPMHPEYRTGNPGVCPRCGMKLVEHVPDRIEYPLKLSHSPAVLRPGDAVTLRLEVLNPETGQAANRFEIVHEKLMHLFLVNQNLEFFAHQHPTLQPDNCFELKIQLPVGGLYRLLADYYPAGSVPQLAVETLFVSGTSELPHLAASLAPFHSRNLSARLRLEPERIVAGLETKLFFSLDPAAGLEPYLGSWAHMLVASADLIDLLHLHPFLVSGGEMQFNVLFPLPGTYRIWTQFQRNQIVNTTVFTVEVSSLG